MLIVKVADSCGLLADRVRTSAAMLKLIASSISVMVTVSEARADRRRAIRDRRRCSASQRSSRCPRSMSSLTAVTVKHDRVAVVGRASKVSVEPDRVTPVGNAARQPATPAAPACSRCRPWRCPRRQGRPSPCCRPLSGKPVMLIVKVADSCGLLADRVRRRRDAEADRLVDLGDGHRVGGACRAPPCHSRSSGCSASQRSSRCPRPMSSLTAATVKTDRVAVVGRA